MAAVTVSDNATRSAPTQFSWLHSLRLGTFHIGSSFADILGSSIWNYVMANGMAALGGFVATPVTLLLALRQLLVPLTIWAGHLSDTHPLFGYRRLPYIWMGRALMLVSLPLLPIATTIIFSGNLLGWLLALLSFVVYGIGTQISGSPFAALVRDSAPKERSGQAYAVVQTVLVAAFAFSPLIYAQIARMVLPVYNPAKSGLAQYNLDIFWLATGVGCVIALITWIFSVLGAEQRSLVQPVAAQHDDAKEFRVVLRAILKDARTRSFFWLLATGAMAGFGQDGILEPSLRAVFGYNFGATQAVVGVWGVGLLISLIGCIALTRTWATVEQVKIARLGLVISALAMAWMAATYVTVNVAMLWPSVFLFGIGFGMYTAGASPLLMVMSLDERAGAYLGLWSMAQLLFRGIGVALGGVIYDIVSRVTGVLPLGYAAVFGLEAVGFAVCIYFLNRSDVRGFALGTQVPSTAALTLMD